MKKKIKIKILLLFIIINITFIFIKKNETNYIAEQKFISRLPQSNLGTHLQYINNYIFRTETDGLTIITNTNNISNKKNYELKNNLIINFFVMNVKVFEQISSKKICYDKINYSEEINVLQKIIINDSSYSYKLSNLEIIRIESTNIKFIKKNSIIINILFFILNILSFLYFYKKQKLIKSK